MNKLELLQWFTEEQQKWELLLAAIGLKRMDQSGVNGEWSMKDVVAHLTGWQWWLVAQLKAARDGRSDLQPNWPKHLKAEDEINAWIYETNRNLNARQVLKDAHQVYEQMRTLIQDLPEDVRIETISSKYHVIWVNGQRFAVGEIFHHFYDDHQANVRAWLSQSENG